MRYKSLYTTLIFATLFLLNSSIEAAYTIQNGKLVNADTVADLPVNQHFDLGMAALKKNDWSEASRQFTIVSCNFPNSPFGQEALYYLGFLNLICKNMTLLTMHFPNTLNVKIILNTS